MPTEIPDAVGANEEKRNQLERMAPSDLKKLHDQINARIAELGQRAIAFKKHGDALSAQRAAVLKEATNRLSRQRATIRRLKKAGQLFTTGATPQMMKPLGHTRITPLPAQEQLEKLDKQIKENIALQKIIKMQRLKLLDDDFQVNQAIEQTEKSSVTKINELVQKYWESEKTNSVLKEHVPEGQINFAGQWVAHFNIEKIPPEHRQMFRVFNAFQTLRDILEDDSSNSRKLTKLQKTMEKFKGPLQNPFIVPGFRGFFGEQSIAHIELTQTIQKLLDQHQFSPRADDSAAAGSTRMQSPSSR